MGRRRRRAAPNRLWAALHKGDQWSQIPDELADTIPRARWSDADITEIDARSLVDELRRTDRGVEAPHEFSIEERDEILSRIEYEDLWRHLPLHTAVGGAPVSAAHDRVYLAPPAGLCDDFLTRDATLIAHSPNSLVERQQEHWLRPLDDRARIEIALGSRDPSFHWRSIMDALETTHEHGSSSVFRPDLGDPVSQAERAVPTRGRQAHILHDGPTYRAPRLRRHSQSDSLLSTEFEDNTNS